MDAARLAESAPSRRATSAGLSRSSRATSAKVMTRPTTASSFSVEVGPTPRVRSARSMAELLNEDLRSHLQRTAQQQSTRAGTSIGGATAFGAAQTPSSRRAAVLRRAEREGEAASMGIVGPDLSAIAGVSDRLYNVVEMLASAKVNPDGVGRPRDPYWRENDRERVEWHQAIKKRHADEEELIAQTRRTERVRKWVEAAVQATPQERRKHERNSNRFEPFPPYKDLVHSAMEYVALFKVNRFVQPENSSVGTVRMTEEMYVELMDRVREAITDVRVTFDGHVSKSINDLSKWLAHRATRLEQAHHQDIDMVKSAYRSRLSDSIARLSFKAHKDLQKQIMDKEKENVEKLKAMDKAIYQTKKDTHYRAYEVSKLRSHVARYQMLLRKHNITETDAYFTVDDERIRTEDVIEHYQITLANKEEKITELTNQLEQLEAFVEAHRLPSAGAGNKAAWHGLNVRDVIDSASNSRRTSMKEVNMNTSRRTTRVQLGSTTSFDGESDYGSALSLGGENANTALVSRQRPSNARKPYVSDLTSVVERARNSKTGQGPAPDDVARHIKSTWDEEDEDERQLKTHEGKTSKAPHAINAAPNPNLDKEVPDTAHGKSRDQTRQPSRDQPPSREQQPPAITRPPDAEITEDEVEQITEEIREKYEERCRSELDRLETLIMCERSEIFRINREFQEQFQNMQNDLTAAFKGSAKLSPGQKFVLSNVQQIFPQNFTRPNHKNIAIQCDIDGEFATERQRRIEAELKDF